MIRLYLQMFAGETEDQPANPPEKPEFEELLKDKAYQSEFDRRVSKALDTAKAKWAEEEAARIAEARTEAEKLAKMNADQKAEHERAQRDKELAEREAGIALRELKAEALAALAERELPAGLIHSVNLTNATACKESIEAVEKAFREAVQAGVEARLKAAPPKQDTAQGQTGTLRDDIRKALYGG